MVDKKITKLKKIKKIQDKFSWDNFMLEEATKDYPKVLQNFYQSFYFSAQTKLADAEFIAIDLETTGLDIKNSAIVSIGLIPFDLHKIYPNRAKYWVLKPDILLSKDSILLHHITHSQIENAPKFVDIFESLVALTAGKIPVVHYKRIERDFLYNAGKKFLNSSWLFPVIDTMALESSFVRQSFWAKTKTFFTGKNESLRLHNSRQRYNLPTYIAHHALVDAMATAELFQAQVAYKLDEDSLLGDLWE